MLQLLAEGESHRHVGETKMNKNSSRSHTIFRMVIESRSTTAAAGGGVDVGGGDVGAIRVSALTLVDLAGSERIAKTGAEGQRAKEGAAINKSLLTLGTVINKLSEGVAAAGGHIPYRDSKLTRILQPSLGGNAKTAIICAITPASQHVEESHSTLRFACRAKRVVNNATVNEVLSDAAVLKRQANEIEELRKALQSSGNAAHIEEEINRLRAELLHKDQERNNMSSALAAEKEERERAQRKVDNMARLMLEGNTAGAVGVGGSPDAAVVGGGKKKKRDSRRETWCPGAGQRKRPLLPNLAVLTEDGVNGSTNASGAQRRSDGGALLSWSAGVSPPRKVQCSESLGGGGVDESARRSSHQAMGGDVSELQARVRELETANDLMQRELDSLAEGAQRTQQQLRDAEDELMSVAEERDNMGPALKEAQWKARQLEKEVAEVAAERDAVSATVTELEAAVAAAQNMDTADGDEVKQQLQTLTAEAARLREELESAEKAKVELAEAQAEKERLNAKVEKAKCAAAEAEEKAKSLADEVNEARFAKIAAEDKLTEVETRARSLYEETERLSAHISDLESRKRAPLYQKRQEDELRATVEKAGEAEARATEAELRAKEAKAAADAAEGRVAKLQEELDRALASSNEEISDLHDQLKVAAQRVAAEAELVAAKHAEALAAAQAREDALAAAKSATEEALAAREADFERLNAELSAQQEAQTALTAELEETKACADAAAQHVQFLEEKAENEAVEAEKEKNALQEQIESLRAEMVTAAEGHSTALAAVGEEKGALVAVNTALEAAKTELEGKVALAAASINAAEELKELRRKYKDETARLNLALKSAGAGSKGTEKAADRAAKDTERLRNQIKDLEGKLRTAIADKNSAQMEKAAVDRELRGAKAQLDKLGKTVSRIAGVEERKRESVMQGFNQAKSRLATLEDSLMAAQTDLERTTFELEGKKAEIENLTAQLEETQRAGEEATARVEDLSAQLEDAECEGEHLRADLNAVRAELSEKTEEAAATAEKVIKLETMLADVEDAKAMVSHEKATLETELKSLGAEAAATAERLKDAEAQLPRIEELQSQLDGAREELETAQSSATANDEAAKTRIAVLEADIALLESKMEEIVAASGQDKLNADAAMQEAAQKIAAAETSLQEHAAYVSSLENQINDSMSEGMELKAAAEGAAQQCRTLEEQLARATATAEVAHEHIEETTAELQATKTREEAAKMELCDVRNELGITKNAAAEVAAEAEGLRAQVAANAENTAALETRLTELECELKSMTSERKMVESELETALTEAARWQAVVEDLRSAQNETDAGIAEKSAALMQAQATVAELESRVAAAEGELVAVREREAEIRVDLESRLTEVQNELEGVIASAAATEAALTEERADAISLASTLESLRSELEIERSAVQAQQELAAQQVAAAEATAERHTAMVAQDSERKIASLNSRIQSLEGQLHRAATEAEVSQQRALAAAGPVGTKLAALEQRCTDLENDLRKSRRREEKLQALQYRLKEDIRQAGGDTMATVFDQLRDVRSLEYELDRVANRAAREKAALKEALVAAQKRVSELENSNSNAAVLYSGSLGSKKRLAPAATVALADKENQIHHGV
ncbi:MAG: hypothetical protein KL787_02525 [Taibaiella sp.]|nr:hypothetical protein [Taibaiella sp.]